MNQYKVKPKSKHAKFLWFMIKADTFRDAASVFCKKCENIARKWQLLEIANLEETKFKTFEITPRIEFDIKLIGAENKGGK